MSDDRFLFSATDCARILGVHRRTFLDWGLEPARKEGSKSLHDICEVVRYHLGAGGELRPGDRLSLAKAEQVEVENQVRQGELVELAEIQSEWKREVTSAKNLLLGIPTRIAPLIAVEENPGVCQQIVRRAITEALDELSEIPEPEGVESAARDNGEPVGGSGAEAESGGERRAG